MWSIQQLQYRCYFIIFKLLGLFPISRIHFLLKFSIFFFQVMVLKWHLLLARYFLNWPLMRKWHITYYLSDCQGFQPSKKLNLPYKTMKLCYSIHTELTGTYFPSSKNIICYSRLRAVPLRSFTSKLERGNSRERGKRECEASESRGEAEGEGGKGGRDCILLCNRRVQISPPPQHRRIGLVDKQ